jgi:hypothetical protein
MPRRGGLLPFGKTLFTMSAESSEPAAESPYEVVALWEGFPPEAVEEWPTRPEALSSARLHQMCRESEYVNYSVRPKARETT